MQGKTPGAEGVIWDLSHLYKGPDDPQIEKDLGEVKARAKGIEETHKGHVKDLTPQGLHDLVRELEALNERFARIAAYAQLDFSTNCTDPQKGAFLQRIREEGAEIQRHLVFFDLEWQKVPEDLASTILKDKTIEHYRHYLAFLRRLAPHTLSEEQEKLLIDLSPVGKSSWITLFEKVMAHLRFGAEERTQEEVLSDLYSPDRNVRKKAHKDFTEGLKQEE
ncbi:MAG TPA: oligoendopeptidase F, partial [Dissulfuribacter thermophilus]|nr:oligoendopeptidase F [Dissulfuribacter thermophilus]